MGLILVYSISGIALNHINDWNPHYQIEKINYSLVQDTRLSSDEVKALFSIEDNFMAAFDETPTRVKYFFNKNTTVVVDTKLMTAHFERVSRRPFFFWANKLHLNHLKGIWPFIADLFAVILILLAISGLFLVKHRWGITPRAWLFLSLGFLLPLIAQFYVK